MPKRSEKKKRSSSGRAGSAKAPRAPAEIPSKASVVATETFTSPKGTTYTILETNQLDPYDDPEEKKEKKRGGD
jgi:hypothetical protein